jgi:hypothetical protein
MQKHTMASIYISSNVKLSSLGLTIACKIAECGNPGSLGDKSIDDKNDGRCNTRDPHY